MSEYLDTRLLVGNCLDTLKRLADNSIDSIVTDPPYELGFMGKSWDNTGIAFNVDIWQECIRVLKPGGHLLAFSGSRTYHRMAVAIEDAGFEIRDQIMWIYGSGFPKSLDISKAIDKSAGVEREVVGQRIVPDQRGGKINSEATAEFGIPTREVDITAPATAEAKQWQGWGTALKPAHEPIVVARKPLIGTVAETVLKYGTGGINIDASRVGFVSDSDKKESTDKNQHADFGTKPMTNNTVYGDYSMIEPKNYEPTGRFPANVILTHNHDCQETGTVTDQPVAGKRTATFGTQETQSGGDGSGGWSSSPVTTTTWSCTPGCPATQFPSSKGTRSEMGVGFNDSNVYGTGDKNFTSIRGYDDNGSAARFFYCAKASKKERNGGLDGLPTKGKVFNGQSSTSAGNADGSVEDKFTTKPAQNFHPTVKPLELMKYLIKLVTPPKGTVLDPFLGSGTTAVAAILEGFDWKGCEMTDDYLPIIKGRVAWARKEVKEKAKQEQLEL